MKHKINSMTASDLMTPGILSVEPGVTVQQAVDLMVRSQIGSVVVMSPIQDIVGIFTERDLLLRVVGKQKDPLKTKIEEVMTRNVMVAQATDGAWDLIQVMNREKFRHLPVVDGRKIIGILSIKDFTDALLQNFG